MTNLNSIKKVAGLLSQHQINFVVGGSGLAYLLGIQKDINDWDLMTEASVESVKRCLTDIDFKCWGPRAPFCSKYVISFQVDGQLVEIIGGFAFELNGQLYEFPAVGNLTRQGLRLANVESWIKIYDLLGQKNKAKALRIWKMQQQD